MNAAVVESFGTPPRYTTFANPLAGDGEVLVRVIAAGFHPIVRALASGSHYGSTGELPFVPGVDGVGRLEDGTRVYFGAARSPFGSFAEISVTKRELTIPLPESVGDAAAAALANPGMSSWVALRERAKFVSGESVLIIGATGAAGKLAVQIARRMGARHIVAVGRHINDGTLKELGADAIVSLDQDHDVLIAALRNEFTEEGIDVVLDYLWGQPAEAVLEAISQKGLRHSAPRIRYVQIGDIAGNLWALSADGAFLHCQNAFIEPFCFIEPALMKVEYRQLFERANNVWVRRTEIDFFDGNELLIIWCRLRFLALCFEHSDKIVQRLG